MKIVPKWWFAMLMGLRRILFAIAFLTLPLIAHAGDMGLAIRHLEVRATAGGMTATGGYAHLENSGLSDVRLVAIEAAFAPKAEIHTMITVDGVMKMRPLEGGIVVPAGGARDSGAGWKPSDVYGAFGPAEARNHSNHHLHF